MNEFGTNNGGIWPPPPARDEPEAWQEPRAPRIADSVLGRVALGLSGLGSLCALLCALSGALDPRGHWSGLWEALQSGAVDGSFAGLFAGFFGWDSWEGKAGLWLAVASPLWVVAALVVAAHRH